MFSRRIVEFLHKCTLFSLLAIWRVVLSFTVIYTALRHCGFDKFLSKFFVCFFYKTTKFVYYVMALSSSALSSSVCRQNGFHVITLDVVDRFWNTMILGTEYFGYCNPTHFQTRGHKLQIWMFLLFVHEELILIIFL